MITRSQRRILVNSFKNHTGKGNFETYSKKLKTLIEDNTLFIPLSERSDSLKTTIYDVRSYFIIYEELFYKLKLLKYFKKEDKNISEILPLEIWNALVLTDHKVEVLKTKNVNKQQ